jgi:hypothetical protein
MSSRRGRELGGSTAKNRPGDCRAPIQAHIPRRLAQISSLVAGPDGQHVRRKISGKPQARRNRSVMPPDRGTDKIRFGLPVCCRTLAAWSS